MKRISRQILIGALVLIFISSACGRLAAAAPTPVWTVTSQSQVQSPTATVAASATPTELSVTPLIPITGENVVFMQCQFCVAGETHTVLIVPDFAYFDVQPSTSVTCLTADVVNGRRILICRGPQLTTFNLNICSDSSNCLQFPVALQECPLLEGGTPSPATPFAPGFLTPINTLEPPDDDEDPTEPASTPVPSQTPIPADKTATSTAPPPANTTEPPPTSTIAPEPTSQPTSEPTFTTGPAEFSGEGVNATPLPPPSGLPD